MVSLLMFLLIFDFSSQLIICKQFMHAYYKTQSQVYPIPKQNDTYEVYLAGKVIKIEGPSVFSKLDMIGSTVVDIRNNSIMSVVNGVPYILTSSGIHRKMIFVEQKFTGSLIALGDGRVLHIPNIRNNELTLPNKQWNYLEMLYFDWGTESVTVTSEIPWLNSEDWLSVKLWRYQDYIYLKDKLFILISRSLSDSSEGVAYTSNELSIICLCLEKDLQILSYPIEVHFSVSDPIVESDSAFFHFKLGANVEDESKRYAIITSNRANRLTIHYISNLPFLFDQNTYDCVNYGPVRFTLFHKHIRSEESACLTTINDKCENGLYAFPSGKIYSLESSTINVEHWSISTGHVDYPLFQTTIYILANMVLEPCELNSGLSSLTCKPPLINEFAVFYPHLYINIPGGDVFVHSFTTSQIYYHKFDCDLFLNCIHCYMFGLSFGCRWAENKCERIYELEEVIAVFTINSCIKIIEIKPKAITSISRSLKIELSSSLPFYDSQESISVSVGPENYCQDVIRQDKTIYCDLVLVNSGFFPINVTIYYEKYGNSIGVTAITKDIISVARLNYTFWIFAISLVIVAVIFIIVIYFATSGNIFLKQKKSRKNIGLFTRLNYSPQRSLKTKTTSTSVKTYEMSQTIQSGI